MRIYLIPWEEKESGWGLRPDGWSLHVSPEEYESYLKRYWSDLERYWETVPRPVPDEYSRPLDKPLLEADIPGDHPLALRLKAEKNIRINQYEDERYELERLTGLKWPG